MAPPEDIARYRGRYDKGWDVLRAERNARQRQLGIIDDRHDITQRPPGVPAWTEVPETERASWIGRMEVYAAMIDRVDQGIGRVLAALEQTGQRENTGGLPFRQWSDDGRWSGGGHSLVPAFEGPTVARTAALFWAYGGHIAVREGHWKLVYNRLDPQPHLELYDLAADPTEHHDLSARYPERAAQLRRDWLAWADKAGAREAASIRALPR